jgi:FKBP-type peptidyl-prolyl cis-trans isomerase
MKGAKSVVLMWVVISLYISSCSDTGNLPTITFEQQWKMDTTEIGKYLRTNNINALTDASGIRFVIDSLASGYPPKSKSSVLFKYKGQLLDGTVFDQGTINGIVKDYILGFQIGLALLPEGTKARLFIPSGYAYGANATSKVPANSNLIFEITLLDVIRPESEKQQLGTDTVAIDNYLAANSIDAIKDKSGLRYVITQLGTGATPSLYSKIKINYTGKLISDGSTFYTGSAEPNVTFDSRVINYLYAFQVGLPKLPEGSKATLYIPSGLGFGTDVITSGGITVPANTNLIYEVELVKVFD